MPEHDNQPRSEPFCSKLDAPHLRWCDDVARNSNHEEVAQALVKNNFCRHARIGTAKYRREWRLLLYKLKRLGLQNLFAAAHVCSKSFISFLKTRERFLSTDHAGFPIPAPIISNGRRKEAARYLKREGIRSPARGDAPRCR